MKTIRDPIHDIIQFDKDSERLLLDLIDTQEFQRLRHIKQLGLASLTYPGAEHTRFAHSLGVTHLMKRFIDKIASLKGPLEKRCAEEIQDNRMLALVSALLHDIGHGPFSHALEKTTKVRHEKWTIKIILENTEINRLLEAYQPGFARQVADVIRRTHSSRAIVKLLSSQLDVDRLDYLLRDSYSTGVGYGNFDTEWLIHSLRIGEVNGEIEVGLDREKGLRSAEDFVLARYYMYENVYFHKATRSAELLIDKIFDRANLLANEKKAELPHDLQEILDKGLEGSTIANYLNLTDHTIWHYFYVWRTHPDPILSDLCDRLVTRRLYKVLPSSPQQDDYELLLKALKLAQKTGVPESYLLLRDNPTTSPYKDSYFHSPKTEEKETEMEASEQIFLFDKSGAFTELSQASRVINHMRNEKLSISRFFVPEQYVNDFMEG